MNKFCIKSLFEHVYWYAVGELQMVDAIQAFARELHRLANCLEHDKRYVPNLKELGW